MYYYALTLRKTAHPNFIHYYEDHLAHLRKKYPHITIVEHFEGTHGLHMHAMVESPKKIHVRQVHPGDGWKLDWQFTRSNVAWNIYVNKDTSKETILINESHREQSEFLEHTRQNTLANINAVNTHEPEENDTNEIINALSRGGRYRKLF